jgi:hypothetical protein
VLEADYPQGDPEAVRCRHCSEGRIRHHGGLLCRTCDGPAHLVQA